MKASRGFTLIELVVTVTIIGALAAIGVPQYIKTLENSKAENAVSTLKRIGAANRMYQLERNYPAAGGSFTNAMNAAACSNAGSSNPGPAADLIGCHFMPQRDWDNDPWVFWPGQTSCGWGGANVVACAKRRTGASPGTTSSAYTSWAYAVNDTGKVAVYGGAPPVSQ